MIAPEYVGNTIGNVSKMILTVDNPGGATPDLATPVSRSATIPTITELDK
jgi:hypothetical protein